MKNLLQWSFHMLRKRTASSREVCIAVVLNTLLRVKVKVPTNVIRCIGLGWFTYITMHCLPLWHVILLLSVSCVFLSLTSLLSNSCRYSSLSIAFLFLSCFCRNRELLSSLVHRCSRRRACHKTKFRRCGVYHM